MKTLTSFAFLAIVSITAASADCGTCGPVCAPKPMCVPKTTCECQCPMTVKYQAMECMTDRCGNRSCCPKVVGFLGI